MRLRGFFFVSSNNMMIPIPYFFRLSLKVFLEASLETRQNEKHRQSFYEINEETFCGIRVIVISLEKFLFIHTSLEQKRQQNVRGSCRNSAYCYSRFCFFMVIGFRKSSMICFHRPLCSLSYLDYYLLMTNTFFCFQLL